MAARAEEEKRINERDERERNERLKLETEQKQRAEQMVAPKLSKSFCLLNVLKMIFVVLFFFF